MSTLDVNHYHFCCICCFMHMWKRQQQKNKYWHPKIKRLLGTDLGTGHNFREINFTEQGVGHYLGGQYILGAVSGPGLWPLSYNSHNAAKDIILVQVFQDLSVSQTCQRYFPSFAEEVAIIETPNWIQLTQPCLTWWWRNVLGQFSRYSIVRRYQLMIVMLLGRYRAVLVNFWWYWVTRWPVCMPLHIEESGDLLLIPDLRDSFER